MDRRLVYIGQIPQDTDILYTNRNAMVSDGFVAQGILGTSTLFSGLACTPTSPPTMTVNVAPGCVFSQQNIDNSAYGSLASDTTEQIMKIGVSLDAVNFACPAPPTSGQSVVYLIEAAFSETDTGSTVLPYFNAANPAMPWAGPNNTGVSQNTMRKNVCTIQVKVGVAATTGTQATPAPDAGFTGLWAVTVANGATTITSGNIAQISGAPFISETLTQKISQATADARYAQIPGVQNGSYIFANDTSGAANTLTATLSPAPTTYTKGMLAIINLANNNTGPSVVNLNGLGNKAITYKGSALAGGEMKAGQNVILSYDGTSFELNSPATSSTSVLFIGGTSTGSANAQAVATQQGNFANTAGNIGTFKAGFSNTGAATAAYDSASALPLKKRATSGLVALVANDLVVNEEYMTICDGTNHQLLDPASNPAAFLQVASNLSDVANPATSLSNLGGLAISNGPNEGDAKKLTGDWVSNSTATFAAGSVIVKDSVNNLLYKLLAFSQTLNTATSGAGGIDTGSLANSTFYNVFAIYNPSGSGTQNILFSLSSTAPTLPSGYTAKALIGAILTDGSGHLVGFKQRGADWQFLVGSNLGALPLMASGSSGSVTTPTWTAVSVSAFAPSTATKIKLSLFTSGAANRNAMAAPNNSYGAITSTTNAPPLASISPGGFESSANLIGEFILESSNVYYAADGAGAGLNCLSFTLNI